MTTTTNTPAKRFYTVQRDGFLGSAALVNTHIGYVWSNEGRPYKFANEQDAKHAATVEGRRYPSAVRATIYEHNAA